MDRSKKQKLPDFYFYFFIICVMINVVFYYFSVFTMWIKWTLEGAFIICNPFKISVFCTLMYNYNMMSLYDRNNKLWISSFLNVLVIFYCYELVGVVFNS